MGTRAAASDAEQEPDPPEYPGRTAAFGRIMRTAHEGQTTVSSMAPLVNDLMKVRDDELVLLSQVRAFAKVLIWQEAMSAEIARRTIDALRLNRDAIDQSTRSTVHALELNRDATDRSTAAMIEFKTEAATASRRL